MSNSQAITGTIAQKVETLQQIDRSWANLLDALDGVPAESGAEPGACGEWSVKDLAGHIAFWASQAGPIATRQASAAPKPEGDNDGGSDGGTDFQAINEEVAAKNSARSYDDLTRELHETHQQMVETLRNLPTLDPDWVAGNTFEHYDEHAAEIREWRRQRGA
ncbi:MAG TPA: maleylpyruvate isomerase N-terminal domain-containing protein [Thermomicrobiales bacterium]|nr:maleylpyruvate isomerase N-terminal domain-containing protein [Thermomicrobiales bacterium]